MLNVIFIGITKFGYFNDMYIIHMMYPNNFL